MKTILLLSSNGSLREDVSKVLPENWSVACFTTMDEIQDHLISAPVMPGKRIPIMVDVSDQPYWGDQLSKLGRERVFIFAIIKEPSEREAAFLTGGDDCLLSPLVPREVEARLANYPFPQKNLTQEYLAQQIFQNERLITIGRLTSHIVHEINNPMQAIRGAVTLALEESNIPEFLMTYLSLCQQESLRVVKLVERMRQLYRPQANWEPVNLCAMLTEALAMASDEMNRLNVSARADVSSNLPLVNGIPNQLYLVFLGILFNLADLVGTGGGGELHCSAGLTGQFVEVNVSADLTTTMADEIQKTRIGATDIFENFLGLSLAKEIILSHHGNMETLKSERELNIRIHLPVLIPEK